MITAHVSYQNEFSADKFSADKLYAVTYFRLVIYDLVQTEMRKFDFLYTYHPNFKLKSSIGIQKH